MENTVDPEYCNWKLQMCSFEISVVSVQLASYQSPDQLILFAISMHNNMGESSKIFQIPEPMKLQS